MQSGEAFGPGNYRFDDLSGITAKIRYVAKPGGGGFSRFRTEDPDDSANRTAPTWASPMCILMDDWKRYGFIV